MSWLGSAFKAVATVASSLIGYNAQKKQQKAAERAAEQAAQQQYDASVQPVATPEAVQQNAIEEETYQNNKKRRFSVARTTMPGASLLGGGAGRTTLG